MLAPSQAQSAGPKALSLDTSISLNQAQRVIRETFGDKDGRRGVEATFLWFMEEVGELASALRDPHQADLTGEFADVLAWLATLANMVGVDLNAAFVEKYVGGCPGCGKIPCQCPAHTKP